MKVYRYGKFIKVVGLISAIILLIASIGILFIPDLNKNPDLNVYYILVPFSIIFFPLSILGIRDVFVSKVILTDAYIESINAIHTRKLRIEEIHGYKQGKNYIHVLPKKRLFKKKLKFSNYISNAWEIEDWLLFNSTNLDLVEEEKEVKDFYRNSDYGLNDEEKEKKLTKARKTTKIVNLISIVLTIAIFFFNEYYYITRLVLLSLPLIIILIVMLFKGIIKYGDLEEGEETMYPSIFWGFAAPIFAIFLKTLFTINILNLENLWSYLILLSVFVFSLCVFGSKEYIIKNTKSYGKLIFVFVLSLMYSYAAILYFNASLDTEASEIFSTIIKEKRISKGKTTSYYFKVSNKNKIEHGEEFTVSKLVYEDKNIGDSITFELKKGKFNIPYYKTE